MSSGSRTHGLGAGARWAARRWRSSWRRKPGGSERLTPRPRPNVARLHVRAC